MLRMLLAVFITSVAGFGSTPAEAPDTKAWVMSPFTHHLIKPLFTVTDWTTMAPLMEAIVEKTKEETGVMYYGWTVNSESDAAHLYCREGYSSGAAVNAHLANVGDFLTQMLGCCAQLLELELHATTDQLEVIKPSWDALGPTYWYHLLGFSHLQPSMEDGPYGFVTIQPTFTVVDWEGAKAWLEPFVDATWSEEGVLYYGWDVLEGNTKFFCNEAYVDADAVLAHMANVGGMLGDMLASGVATLDRVHFSGPEAEIAKLKESPVTGIDSGLNAEYFTTTAPSLTGDAAIDGFIRYTVDK